MEKEVIELISSTLEVDKKSISKDTDLLNDLDVESLDLVDLVTAFEDKYSVEIADKDIKDLHTVGDIVNYIKKRQDEA
ncbi:acyl carrier protein [Candidatus Saccharibacteria bacterium]|jgi:acyl carrier protein|nr:acyl carrier protein [Candidatus Saccharibacteria bacterium]